MIKGPAAGYFVRQQRTLKTVKKMNLAKFEGLAAALYGYENPQDEYGGRMDSFKELVVSPDRKKKQKTTKAADDFKFLHYLFLYPATGATLNNSAYGSENILGKGLFPMKLKKGGRVSVNVDINGMIAFFSIAETGKIFENADHDDGGGEIHFDILDDDDSSDGNTLV